LDIQCILENTLAKYVKELGDRKIDSILRSFTLLSCGWTKNEQLREVVFTSFCEVFDSKRVKDAIQQGRNNDGMQYVPQDAFCSCVSYFQKSGMRWNELPIEVKETIIHAASHYCPVFRPELFKNLLLR
jgi:hypothetical protein